MMEPCVMAIANACMAVCLTALAVVVLLSDKAASTAARRNKKAKRTPREADMRAVRISAKELENFLSYDGDRQADIADSDSE